MSEPVNVTRARRRRVILGPTRSATAALRLLELCPLLPADAFRYLAGFRSTGGAYARLEKLKQAGLADVQCVDLGYLVSDRPIGLWDITEEGLRAINAPADESLVEGNATRLHAAPMRRWRKAAQRSSELATRVAAYRLLAYLVGQWRQGGQVVDLCSWEHPWVRALRLPDEGMLRVQLPAVAVLNLRKVCEERATAGSERISIVLVPEFGAAPVARYREMLRRLLAYRDASGEDGFEVVVATVDSGRDGSRARAWWSLLNKVACGDEGIANSSRVVTWLEVDGVLSPHRTQREEEAHRTKDHAGRGDATRGFERAPRQTRDQLLHLVGRHPFLTSVQLAQLLGTTTAQIRRLEDNLVTCGWLRQVELDELHPGASGLSRSEISRLGLVEITVAGRRRLASWLGLDSTTAARYHGLIGAVRSSSGRRGRLLRNLTHTLGVNAVFVALAVASEAVNQAGGADRLAHWRGAAACERGQCKPDGYGCYVRNGLQHGFFLEYDRGTESARKYRAKLHAYYRYRDTGAAGRDYDDGFPTLLFVTTEAGAEWRIADQAHRVWFARGSEPLPILITTTNRIRQHDEGVLGPIWRTPVPEAGVERRYWLTGGTPGRWFGSGSKRFLPPQLAWPTAGLAERRTAQGALSGGQDGRRPHAY